jgi:hypothetical protein
VLGEHDSDLSHTSYEVTALSEKSQKHIANELFYCFNLFPQAGNISNSIGNGLHMRHKGSKKKRHMQIFYAYSATKLSGMCILEDKPDNQGAEQAKAVKMKK